MNDFESLVQKAITAKNSAIAPYSHFPVGAALLTKNGAVYTGCNIESSSYGLTICAERVAIFKALSEGERDFKAIAIATDIENFCPPCGACRQVLWDFAKDINVILISADLSTKTMKMSDFLPHAFDDGFLPHE